MKHIDSRGHVRGESLYVDDLPLREGTLFGVPLGSPVAHGRILELDVQPALAMDGVRVVLTARDIPGENQVGGIFPDEPLFADGEVHYAGQPVALVLADQEEIARAAVKRIRLEIEPLPVVVDPREAAAKNDLIGAPRTFSLGDIETVWDRCEVVVEDTVETGGQEHLYIETQGAYAFGVEDGGVRILSSTQGPTAVQRTAAKVLGIPMHKIEVEVTRLGGGFGGKEDQATPWGVMAALGAFRSRRPVKVVLHRLDDMAMTGKRHPYSSDFKIGLDRDLKILAYEVTFYQNAGAAADLSPAILERTLFHATNSYYIPNVKITAMSCRTNLPPNTAFRGFGGPQGMFVMEAAIVRAAEKLGVEASRIQETNLLEPGDSFPYGQTVEGNEVVTCWRKTRERYQVDRMLREIEAFNRSHHDYKKGLAWMPVCFGISFTKTHMNQARALVHVYHDGSIGVSTGAVEMGQGVNTKMVQVASGEFSVHSRRIKMERTNTTRIANTSPTAASASSDLNGKALVFACSRIRERLLEVAARDAGHGDPSRMRLEEEVVFDQDKPTGQTWESLVWSAYTSRVNLSEHAHYSTPDIYFDTDKEKGHPFAYHANGTAVTMVTVDCLRGNYVIDGVHLVHDYGKSMNPVIDRGQTEGAVVQGIGWMTMEELLYDDQGRLQSNALSTYKIPDIYAVPRAMDIAFLETEGSPLAIFRSKAIGEPPLMYGIGAYFAIRDAIRAARPETRIPFSAPLTPEKVLRALYPEAAHALDAAVVPATPIAS